MNKMSWKQIKIFIVVILYVGVVFFTPSFMGALLATQPTIQDKIVQWVVDTKSQVVTPSVMLRIAKIESNYNPRAKSPTGCKGLYQFCSKAWESIIKQYGARDGVKRGDIWSARANTIMAVRLAEANAREFKKFDGRNPEPFEVYMMHNIGTYSTIALIVANRYGEENKLVSEEEFGLVPRYNPKYLMNKGKPVTVEEAIRRYKKEFEDLGMKALSIKYWGGDWLYVKDYHHFGKKRTNANL